MRNVIPVLTVLALLAGLWWAAVAPMNIRPALDQVERSGGIVVPEGSVQYLAELFRNLSIQSKWLL